MIFRHISFGCGLFLFLSFFLIGMCTYFVGYPKYGLINQSLRQVNTTIISQRYFYRLSCYSCNCHKNSCSTCCDFWWDHYISVEYTPEEEIVLDFSTVREEIFLYSDHVQWINHYYDIGNVILAYYNPCAFRPKSYDDMIICEKHGDMGRFFLSLKDRGSMMGAAIASVVICSLSFILICVSGGMILYRKYRNTGFRQWIRNLFRKNSTQETNQTIEISLEEGEIPPPYTRTLREIIADGEIMINAIIPRTEFISEETLRNDFPPKY